jgi:hypothetical protein
MRQSHIIPRSDLRHHHDASDFLHQIIVRRRNTVYVPSNLRFQITNGNVLFEDILRKHIRVPRLLDFVRMYKDMVSS